MITPFRLLMLSLFALMAVAPLAAQDLIEEANQAFAAGDQDRALALYDQVLSRDPDNIHALFRSGQLLSWTRRFTEAVERYDRLLGVQPDHFDAMHERAKVLSWDQRFGEAEAAFRALLARDPSHREARIGLARVLSWSGQQSAARAEYERVLEQNERDVDAAVGVAQTWAWSGQRTVARQWYERALEVEQGALGSLLGVAYLDLAEGDLRSASRIANQLAAEHPQDRDVAELVRAVETARRPWYRAAWERLEDTDDNELDISRLEIGWTLPARARLTLGISRFDMSSPFGEGRIDSPSLTVVASPGVRSRLTARLGADFREDSTGNSSTELIGGLAWQQNFSDNWRVVLAGDHDSFRYSVPILDAGITTTSYGVRLHGDPGDYFRMTLGTGGASYSDDNRQQNADVGLWLRLPVRAFTLQIGYVGRYLDFDHDFDNGYFDPQDFRSHVGQLLGRGNFGTTRAYWDFRVESGVQSFTLGGRDVKNEELLGWFATLGLPLGRAASLELFGGKSDYALQAATGFESTQYGVRLRLQP
jgi:thioredoxin-like negative regulator of GroEL